MRYPTDTALDSQETPIPPAFWWVVYLLGGVVGILLTASILFFAGWIRYIEALKFATTLWVPYLLTAPVLARFVRRVPFESGKWVERLWIYILALVVFVIATESAQFALSIPLLPGPAPSPSHLMQPSPLLAPPPGAGPLTPMPLPSMHPPEAEAQPGVRVLALVGIKALFDVPIFCLIVSAVQLVRSTSILRERERQHARLQAAFTQAKLQSLQQQLQPHFLFNTLNSISALIHDDPVRADQMLGDLAGLLRSTLEQDQTPETSLQRELELLGYYIAIQTVRFGERLRFALRIAPETLPMLVPTFILQPLVENAILHGIGNLPEGGTVQVESEVQGNRLILRLQDDGCTTDAGKAEPVVEGIGLGNTRSRIATLYGEEGYLQVQRRKPAGFSVEFGIPIRMSTPQTESAGAQLTSRERS